MPSRKIADFPKIQHNCTTIKPHTIHKYLKKPNTASNNKHAEKASLNK
jgi:hypothetical protein